MSGRRRALTTDNVKAKTRKAAAAPKGRRAASADDVKKEKKSDAASSDTVKVVVRMRPFNTKEKNEKRGPCIELDIDANQVVIYDMENKAPKPTNFTFDSVYGENTIQQDFYDKSCRPLVASVLQGFNGTIFAYGQVNPFLAVNFDHRSKLKSRKSCCRILFHIRPTRLVAVKHGQCKVS